MARNTTNQTPATAAELPSVSYENGPDDSLTVTLRVSAAERKLEAHGVSADLSSVAAPGLVYLLANGWNGAITDSVSGHKAKYAAEGRSPKEIEAALDATRQAKGQAICAGEMRLGGGGGARIDPVDRLIRDTAMQALQNMGKLPKDAKIRDSKAVIEDFLATPKGKKIAEQARAMAALLDGND